jgi:drug/metabolite transporter (DMT)-like permease
MGGGSGSSPVLGNILSLLSALTYAAYSVMLSKVSPGGLQGPTMSMFFAAMGSIHAVVMLPGVMWYAAKGQVVAWACAIMVAKGMHHMW